LRAAGWDCAGLAEGRLSGVLAAVDG
jgi:hypothetical protein